MSFDTSEFSHSYKTSQMVTNDFKTEMHSEQSKRKNQDGHSYGAWHTNMNYLKTDC